MSCAYSEMAAEQAQDDFLNMSVADFIAYLDERNLTPAAIGIDDLVCDLVEDRLEEIGI